MVRIQRRGRLNYVTAGFLLLIFLIVGLCTREVWNVKLKIQEKREIETNEIACREQGDILQDTSDFLTEQFRLFVFTEKDEYLNLYLDEIENKKNREKAIEVLRGAKLTDEEMELADAVKRESDRLADREIWAMRLLAEAKGAEAGAMPRLLQTVELHPSEVNASREEKRQTVYNFLFGEEYGNSKNIIDTNLREFRSLLRSRKKREIQEAAANVEKVLARVQLYIIIAIVLVVVQVAVFYHGVVLPFMRYLRELAQIDKNTRNALCPGGSYEMRMFASRFNRIYEDLQHQKKKLERMSAVDALTGIANRATLDAYVKRLLESQDSDIGLLMMDVDDFKSFNDGYGHLIGDQVLICMGRCFERIAIREGGIAGRLGGEEFVIVVPQVTLLKIDRIAMDILESVRSIDARELGIQNEGVRVTISVGSTLWPRGRKGDINSLIHQADMALYRAKAQGKNQHVVFSETEDSFILLENKQIQRKEVKADMYHAMEKDEFVPFFQPQFDINTGKICGAEVLVRWAHEKKGFLYPDYFIPILEEDGIITKIDLIMFDKICQYMKEWIEQGFEPVHLACNFSRLHFGKGDLAEKLERITSKYGVPPSMIQVELTESALMERDNFEQVEEEFRELREAGFTIAIDDFGTGYSSLGMLHECSLDVLKVDQSFVHRDLNLRANELLLNGILYIAHVMKMNTVVEGVETKEQVEVLKRLGFSVVQGYYYSKPVEKKEFELMIKKQEGVHDEKRRSVL